MLAIVKGTCGHEYEKNITVWGGQEPGPRQLPKQIKYWETRECIDCFRGKQAAEVAEVSENLPLLTGSEKQVNWANTIRTKAVLAIEKYINQDNDTPLVFADPKARFELLKRCHSAKFWIDTRTMAPGFLLGRADVENDQVTTVWYTEPVQIISKAGYHRMVGGTKPRTTYHDLVDAK